MIRIRGLEKTYSDGKQALCGLDLDVGDGMVGVLGPNGAGKTTLLSILVLAREPSRGTLDFDGLDPRRGPDRARIRRQVGYLPQDFAPIPHLTGAEYLVHCARLRGLALSARRLRERVRVLLEAVGLEEAARRRAGTYSGGMRRRLGVAQALIHAPRLVVVDEPTAGLDPEERIRFRHLIADVAEETAVLLSTHVVEDVEATCPRLVIVGRGRVLYDGTPGRLFDRVRGRLWSLPAGGPVPESAVTVGRRVGEDGRVRLVLLGDGLDARAQQHDPSLEDVYAAFLAEERGVADDPGEGPT